MSRESNGEKLGCIVYNLQADLASNTSRTIDQETLANVIEDCAQPVDGPSAGFSTQLYRVFEGANNVVRDYQPGGSRRYLLTQRAVGTANDVLRPMPIDHGDIWINACFQSELYVVRSLEYHERNDGAFVDHAPAAVLFDTEDEPFAYQKSSGFSSAIAWRRAILATRSGARRIPAGSFFELQYGGDHEITSRYAESGASLISLEGALLPDDVRLLRFSTLVTNLLLARRAAEYAMRSDQENAAKLQENLPGLDGLRISHIGNRVARLLSQDRALRVAS